LFQAPWRGHLCLRIWSKLTERKRKNLNTRIVKLDFKGPVHHAPFLPDELIHPGFPNLTRTIHTRIDPVIFTGRSPVKLDSEPHTAAVLRRTQHHMQVTRMKPEDDLTWRRLKRTALRDGVPHSSQSPLVQLKRDRRAVRLRCVIRQMPV